MSTMPVPPTPPDGPPAQGLDRGTRSLPEAIPHGPHPDPDSTRWSAGTGRESPPCSGSLRRREILQRDRHCGRVRPRRAHQGELSRWREPSRKLREHRYIRHAAGRDCAARRVAGPIAGIGCHRALQPPCLARHLTRWVPATCGTAGAGPERRAHHCGSAARSTGLRSGAPVSTAATTRTGPLQARTVPPPPPARDVDGADDMPGDRIVNGRGSATPFLDRPRKVLGTDHLHHGRRPVLVPRSLPTTSSTPSPSTKLMRRPVPRLDEPSTHSNLPTWSSATSTPGIGDIVEHRD